MASKPNDKQDRNSRHSEVMLYMDELSPSSTTNDSSNPADRETAHVYSNGISLLVDTVDEVEARRAAAHHKDEATPSTTRSSGAGGAGGANNKPRLLETDNVNNPRPTHGPEVDDLVTDDDDDDERHTDDGHPRKPNHNGHHSGIDDGLLPEYHDEDKVIHPAGGVSPSIGSRAPSPHPGQSPNFTNDSWGIGFNEIGMPSAAGVMPRVPPDLNLYQQKKIVAQGMMDLALFSANANQLRYVLQASSGHPYYYPALVMICSSLVLQSVVGMFLIWNSRYNVKDDEQLYKANRSNNWLVIAVFVVTILNVFISSFGVVDIPRFDPSTGFRGKIP